TPTSTSSPRPGWQSSSKPTAAATPAASNAGPAPSASTATSTATTAERSSGPASPSSATSSNTRPCSTSMASISRPSSAASSRRDHPTAPLRGPRAPASGGVVSHRQYPAPPQVLTNRYVSCPTSRTLPPSSTPSRPAPPAGT